MRRSYRRSSGDYPATDMLLLNAYTDYEGDLYDAVIIGDQVWLAENLHTKYLPDGTLIPLGTDNTYEWQARYWIYGSVADNGYYYNASAVFGNDSPSSANPSGVQGIAMSGWHVPSLAEFQQLGDYLDDNGLTLKSIASPYYWVPNNAAGSVAYRQYHNNSKKLNLTPSGYASSINSPDNTPGSSTRSALFSATSMPGGDIGHVYCPIIDCDYISQKYGYHYIDSTTTGAFPVRLVANKTASQFASEYFTTYGSEGNTRYKRFYFFGVSNVHINLYSTVSSGTRGTIKYRFENSDGTSTSWTQETVRTDSSNYWIHLNKGDKIEITHYLFSSLDRFHVKADNVFECWGDIGSFLMDSIDNENYANTNIQLYRMFIDNTNIINAPSLRFKKRPSSSLYRNYTEMFYGCDHLYKAPYIDYAGDSVTNTQKISMRMSRMFSGCNFLHYAGEIKQRRGLKCDEMFYNCSCLLATPVMRPVGYTNYTAQGDFSQMFRSCVQLQEFIGDLSGVEPTPSSVLGEDYNDFDGTFYCMFYHCDNLDTPPERLPSNFNGSPCVCFGMFTGSKITTIPQMLALYLTKQCYCGMFNSCLSLVDLSDCEISAITMSDRSCAAMFTGCHLLVHPPKMKATSLATDCCFEMFMGCHSLTESPELPAINLAANCYAEMFYGCSALSKITMMSISQIGNDYTDNWVYNVQTQSGTFVKNTYAEWSPVYDDSNIPLNWSVSDMRTTPFTIRSHNQNGTVIRMESVNNMTVSENILYSINDGQWSTWHNISSDLTIQNGDCIRFKSTNIGFARAMNSYIRFNIRGQCTIEGNIMSLIYGDNFSNANRFPATSTGFNFANLFYGCVDMDIATDTFGEPLLVLPATRMLQYSYYGMFRSSGVTITPYLKATTMAANCYNMMFANCLSLKNAKEISASPNATKCFGLMFSGCTKLQSIVTTATAWDTENAINWMSDVHETGTFSKLASTSIPTDNTSGIPQSWEVVTI